MTIHQITWVILAAAMALTTPAVAAVTDRTWDGSVGDGLWASANNWDPADTSNPAFVPDTHGTSGEKAIITDLIAADRTITTPGVLTRIEAFEWTQQAAASGVNKIVLGADLRVEGHTQTVMTNATGNPANMVLDLNGMLFYAHARTDPGPMTIMSSSGMGVLETGTTVMSTSALIGPNVTIKINGGGAVWSLGVMDSTSLMLLTGATTQWRAADAYLGDLQVGVPASTNTTRLQAVQISRINVAGDVTIYGSTTNLTGQNLALHNHASSVLAVAGHFIDLGHGTASNYGPGAIAFYGSPTTARTVSITHQNLVNNFRVGDNGSDLGGLPGNVASAGNIILGQDLTTSGTFLVRGGSAVNVAHHTLATGAFTSDAGAIYTFTAGGDTGVIDVTGNLTLNAFTLNIVRDGTWDYLHDLVLFTYTGSFSGTGLLTLGSVPGGFVYDGLVIDTENKVVYLSHVGLPEPTSGAVLVGCLGLIVMRRCRR